MKMVKKCVYCSIEIADDCVVDMCERCMHGVWGEKMAKTIIENMERERDAGNLDLGQVSGNGCEKECGSSCREKDIESIDVEELVIDEVGPEELKF